VERNREKISGGYVIKQMEVENIENMYVCMHAHV